MPVLSATCARIRMLSLTDKPLGFTKIPNAIIDNPALSMRDKVVLFKLARHGYGKMTVYPSQVEIAKSLGIQRETVKTALESLTAVGVIRPHGKGRSGKQETYTIDLDRAANLTAQPAGFKDANLTDSPSKPDGLAGKPDGSSVTNKKAEEKNNKKGGAEALLAVRGSVDSGATLEDNNRSACLAKEEEPDGSSGRSKPGGRIVRSKKAVNDLLLTPDGKIALNSYDDLDYDLNSLTLATLGGEWIPESELAKLVELRGVRYCAFWTAWLPRKVASEYAKGKPVKNPAGLYRRAIEEAWQVDPSWPEFDETQHVWDAKAERDKRRAERGYLGLQQSEPVNAYDLDEVPF